jgi:hypothetical protein
MNEDKDRTIIRALLDWFEEHDVDAEAAFAAAALWMGHTCHEEDLQERLDTVQKIITEFVQAGREGRDDDA